MARMGRKYQIISHGRTRGEEIKRRGIVGLLCNHGPFLRSRDNTAIQRYVEYILSIAVMSENLLKSISIS
jgi:hypothetical protein